MKRFYLILFSLLLSCSIFGQAPSWAFATSIGGADVDNASDLTTDNTGNVYVIGSFKSTIQVGSLSASSRGAYDIFVAKFSPTGTPLWLKSLGSTSDDAGFAITSDGNDIFATGTYTNNLYYTSTNFIEINGLTNKSNIVVFKMEGSTGNVVWANSAGGTGFLAYNLYPKDIALSSSGSVIVAGGTAGEVRWGTTATGFTVRDTCYDCGFVSAWGQNVGTYGWTYTVRNPAYSFDYDCVNGIKQIALDSNNNIYAIGNYNNRNIGKPARCIFPNNPLYTVGTPGLTTQTALGSSAFYVFKIAGDGLFQYVKDGSNSANKWVDGRTIWIDKSAEDLYIGGLFTDTYFFSGATGSTSSPNTNAFLIKADLNSNLEWERHSSTSTPSNSGGNGIDYLTGNDKGGVYFGISVQADCDWYGHTAQGNTSSFSQVMLGRVDANGGTIWTKNIDPGTSQFVQPPAMHAISTATTDECWVAGYHSGFGIYFDSYLVSGNNYSMDGFLAKLGSTSSSAIEEVGNNQNWNIYPNPALAEVWVSSKELKLPTFDYTIYDLQGRIVQAAVGHSAVSSSISLEKLNSGIYILEILQGEELSRVKLEVL